MCKYVYVSFYTWNAAADIIMAANCKCVCIYVYIYTQTSSVYVDICVYKHTQDTYTYDSVMGVCKYEDMPFHKKRCCRWFCGVYVYIYVYVYTHTYIYMYIHTHMTCTAFVCIHTCICIYTYTRHVQQQYS